MRRILIALGLVFVALPRTSAQIGVYDPAVTARNTVTAAVKEFLLTTQREQHGQLRRWAQRLSLFTELSKYARPDAPLWRIHDFESPDLLAITRAYAAALNYGDSSGAAFLAASHPVISNQPLPALLSAAARQAVLARLATVTATDASSVAATHNSGLIRFNGRRELRAIEALERHVIDPSLEQSATAVLDKISGASLIAGRQRQARVQVLTSLVEQLLVDTKRARDSETQTINMQLTTWRDSRTANEAFVAGSGDALRTWRQP
jgi:hypothetical protein